mmetsp:Transcript_31548/g.66090  ORF Transcript_31548/g.66090 Transcript_31548/m.66090 type:complete len:203 (-) Transcript_31548:272-880(-)
MGPCCAAGAHLRRANKNQLPHGDHPPHEAARERKRHGRCARPGGVGLPHRLRAAPGVHPVDREPLRVPGRPRASDCRAGLPALAEDESADPDEAACDRGCREARTADASPVGAWLPRVRWAVLARSPLGWEDSSELLCGTGAMPHISLTARGAQDSEGGAENVGSGCCNLRREKKRMRANDIMDLKGTAFELGVQLSARHLD